MDPWEKRSNCHSSEQSLAHLSSNKIIYPNLYYAYGATSDDGVEDYEGPTHNLEGRR